MKRLDWLLRDLSTAGVETPVAFSWWLAGGGADMGGWSLLDEAAALIAKSNLQRLDPKRGVLAFAQRPESDALACLVLCGPGQPFGTVLAIAAAAPEHGVAFASITHWFESVREKGRRRALYRVVLTYSGVPDGKGAEAARNIEQEFTLCRPHHHNVTCSYAGGVLTLAADNDYDPNGLALMNEFSDSLCAYDLTQFGGDLALQSADRINPTRNRGLAALLDSWEPLDETLPDIADPLPQPPPG